MASRLLRYSFRAEGLAIPTLSVNEITVLRWAIEPIETITEASLPGYMTEISIVGLLSCRDNEPL